MRNTSNDRAQKPLQRHAASVRAPAPERAQPSDAASFDAVSIDPATLTGSAWSFDGVLRRVLGFSRAAEIEGTHRTPPALESSRGARRSVRGGRAGPRAAFDALGLFVRTLDQETRDKLQTLMQAGREGLALSQAHVALSRERDTPGYETPDLFIEGAASLQNLQRGHAVACATGFDLELSLSGWTPEEGRPSLDERVWLRFGRELALSTPRDWTCLALVNAKKELLALFLRSGDNAWWSFDSVIDRPTKRQMARRRSGRVPGRGRLVALPLEALVARRCRNDRKALRRAALAMSARLGRCRMSSDDSLGVT